MVAARAEPEVTLLLRLGADAGGLTPGPTGRTDLTRKCVPFDPHVWLPSLITNEL